MSKSFALFAMALGMIAVTAGSAFAEGGCGSYTQSVALETQTASTASTGAQAPYTPLPKTGSD